MKWRFFFCCILFTATGVLLILCLLPLNVDFYFWRYQTYFGGALLALILLYGVFSLNKNIRKEGGKLLSSNITSVYKFFTPLIFLSCLIADNLLLICKWFRAEDFPIFVCLYIVIVIFLFFQNYRLKTLYVVGNTLIVSNFFEEKTYQFSEIVGLKKKRFYFYQLIIHQNGKLLKYKILPHISEEFAKSYLLIESTDMKEFIKKLDKVIKSNRRKIRYD